MIRAVGLGSNLAASLALQQKRRTVLCVVPCPGYFVASFALSDRACQAATESRLPAQVRDLIQRAPQYPEGRALRLAVRALAGGERANAHDTTATSAPKAILTMSLWRVLPASNVARMGHYALNDSHAPWCA